MRLNEMKIRELASEYQSCSGGERPVILERFRKEVELYIYHFPRWAFRKDNDWCSGFYLFMVERLSGVLTNFPLGSGVGFKTWFNAVLRNRLIDFARYQRKSELRSVSLEEVMEDAPVETIEGPGPLEQVLPLALESLKNDDRLAIRLFYFPENLSGEDLKLCAERLDCPLLTVFQLQRELIEARRLEVQKVREIAEKVGEMNEKLSRERARLISLGSREKEKSASLLAHIARLDAARWKLIHSLCAPEKEVMKVFERCYRKPELARAKLNLAKKRLKFEWTRLAGTVEEECGAELREMA